MYYCYFVYFISRSFSLCAIKRAIVLVIRRLSFPARLAASLFPLDASPLLSNGARLLVIMGGERPAVTAASIGYWL